MSLSAPMREALAARKADANLNATHFDFEREGSLATFWRQATPGTAYWRGLIPMLALPGQLLPIVEDSLAQAEDGSLILNRHRGVAIWQFLGDDGRSRIALQLKRQGVRTLMEVDDAYLRVTPTLYGKNAAWQKTHAEAVANGTGYSVEMHRKVAPLMDGIIVATEQLADEYADINDNIYLCQNSILPEDWEDFSREESDVLRIGYYGSPSHMRDWPLVKKALKWAQRQKDVEVVLVGFRPPGWTGRVIPWADSLFEARKGLGHLDVGIAPLARNPWSDCKSDLKALEYAMAGVMPIVQDAPPYSPWADIGWPFRPSTAADWDEVIRDVVRRRDMVKAWAASAKTYVVTERTIEKNIHSWREAVQGG